MKILFVTVLMIFELASAVAVGPVIFKGKIKSYDSQTVTMESGSHRYQFPRKLLISKDLKAGSEVILQVPPEDAKSVKIEKIESAKK